MTLHETPKRVTDSKGRSYDVSGYLGQGGQGSVYSLSGGKLAAKLLFTRSQLERDRLRSKLAWLRTLPLESVAIATPLELLAAPHIGYLMQFCSGMVSAERLLSPPRRVSSIVGWYLETGGLRRRLCLLARIAEGLARLHGLGLAFADVSPHNIFVSEDPRFNEIRLIDADNLSFESSPSDIAIHTPGFGAPEVVRGESGINTMTDAYSFAVIAFQMLSLVHPLLGDRVRDGEPELEQQAFAGRLPWIGSQTDDSNRSSDGIPRELVISRRLNSLFDRNFGAGLLQPSLRPRTTEWRDALGSAHRFTIKCGTCNSSYYAGPQCPMCDSLTPTIFRVALRAWSQEMELSDPDRLRRWRLGAPSSRYVFTAEESCTLLASVIGAQGSADIVVTSEDRGVGVTATGPNWYWIEQPSIKGAIELGIRKRILPLGDGIPMLLHFGPPSSPHLVAEFEAPPRKRS